MSWKLKFLLFIHSLVRRDWVTVSVCRELRSSVQMRRDFENVRSTETLSHSTLGFSWYCAKNRGEGRCLGRTWENIGYRLDLLPWDRRSGANPL